MAFSNYWPLSFTLILMAGFGAWVFIHSNRSYLLRWIIVPLSLCVSVVSAKVYDAALGYALQGDLPAKFLYLGHHVVVEQNRKTAIEVWTKAGKTRLYRISYSKSAESAMDAAREQAKTGQPVLMERREGPAQEKRASRFGGRESAGEPIYESRIVLPSEINPKT
ncbi:MAG TPA: hypothetical protein VLW55_09350 [Burkholderiaceae bacterium]|nr:hypothetical protein [Burkholderiaceae bacterium]